MNNPYSITLLLGMILLLLTGGLMSFFGNLFGLIPMILGAYVATGFKILDDSPREVGIISFLGVKKEWKVEGLTLLFKPFNIWKIVDVVIIDMQQKDIELDEISNIRCSDNGTVSGKISLTIKPDESDDPPGRHNRKSGVQKLIDYDNAGQETGVRSQLNDIALAWIQEKAKRNNSIDMSVNGINIGRYILSRMMGVDSHEGEENSDIDDARGLGVEIKKVLLKLHREQKVVDAEQKTLVTDVMNARVEKRVKEWREKYNITLDPNKAREQLVEEDMNADGRLQEVRNKGGANFTNIQPKK